MPSFRRTQDHFGRRAKKEGKAARSIYKLEEIDERWQILRRGSIVLDLGCAPGSWMQYTAAKVGPEGRVLGYDLKPINVSLPAHAETRVGDAFQIPDADLPATIDVVLSDMAPSTMGDHRTDAARSAALAERALGIAAARLRAGGHVVVKVLEGGDVPAMVRAMRATYSKVEQLRPEATRKHSTEIFLIGLAKKGTPP
jgi:23S rRNA (uridine2552-2'-O)-methyltransferase